MSKENAANVAGGGFANDGPAIVVDLGEERRRERAHKQLRTALGPLIVSWLEDPLVIEVMLNPDGSLWVERLGEPMVQGGVLIPSQATEILNVIAGILDTTVTVANPVLECELPLDGSRFEGLIPPVVTAPTFTIRRKASRVFTIDEYVASGTMTAEQAAAIKQAIRDHNNILVVGGTGSGKTTLANALIHESAAVFPDKRFVIIEDTAELQCAAKNVVPLRANVNFSMQDCLKATLRLRPDKIIVGEVRGKEALALLKAWNTGHPGGCATVHANDARAGLTRIENLVAEGSMAPAQTQIAEAINLVVVIAKTAEGRRIRELLHVHSWDGQNYLTSST